MPSQERGEQHGLNFTADPCKGFRFTEFREDAAFAARARLMAINSRARGSDKFGSSFLSTGEPDPAMARCMHIPIWRKASPCTTRC